jgi:endonuclease/exonuclease/phosphatase family metal-dependent hydrolase
VIGADLNARPEEPGPRSLGERFVDVWTAVGEGDGASFPSSAPTARIDYLFVSPAVRPLRAWTAGGAVSDHLMVVADLVIEG